MPTTEHIHLPLYTDEETPDLSPTGHYNHAMEILDANVGELEAKDAELAADIADEREARTDADTALDTAYKAADTALGKRIDAETTAREAADVATRNYVNFVIAGVSGGINANTTFGELTSGVTA